MEFDEDYSERNIDGARMVTKFKWESNEMVVIDYL